MAQTCPAELEPYGEAARVREGFEIMLTDGRMLKPLSLAPFGAGRDGPAREAAARERLADRLRGELVFGPSPPPAEDRWGRIAGQFYAKGDNVAGWLAANGLIRIAPAAGDACAGVLLKAEEKGRKAKLGLWADSYYAVLAAADPVAFGARNGEFVVAEGRIFRLGQTSARFYLDFGPARGADVSVTISKLNAKAFAAAGVDVQSLTGQRVRVRGLLEERPGPTLDVAIPLALEVIGR